MRRGFDVGDVGEIWHSGSLFIPPFNRKENRVKTKNKKKKFEQIAKALTESPGSYYVRKGRNNNWYLMIETYVGGKRKQQGVEQNRFNELGLTKTMTLAQARTKSP